MSRPLRIEYPSAYYHVMNRGLTRQKVFKDRSDRERFLTLLGECHEMWGIRVIAYCLMDTHYHLFFQTPEANLSRVMRHLDGVYTQRFNRNHKKDGPLFRGRYKAIVVDAEEYLLAVTRYIHHNPVEAGLTRSPEFYEWSSCRIYLQALDGRKIFPWLEVKQLLDRFSDRKNRKTEFMELMKSKTEGAEKEFYEKKRWPPVFGTDDFIQKIKKEIKKGRRDPKEIPEAKPFLKPDFQTILKIVGKVYRMNHEALMRHRRGERNEGRAVAMVVCRRLCGMKLEEVARVFGQGGYSTAGSMIWKTMKEIDGGGEITKRYAQIRHLLDK